MNEEDKLLSSTLSTSLLLFWAVNETETVWERKQTHNQSQAKDIKERRVQRSRSQAGNGAKRGRQWDGKGRALVTTPCPKEKALSSEQREGCWTLLLLLRMGGHEPRLTQSTASIGSHVQVPGWQQISHTLSACKSACNTQPSGLVLCSLPPRERYELVESSICCHANRRLQGMHRKGQKEQGFVTGLERSITPLTTPSKNPLPKSNDREKQGPKLFELKYCLCRVKLNGLE